MSRIVHNLSLLKEAVGAARRQILLKETVKKDASEREQLAELGRRLVRLREAKGWTRGELARRLGVTRERLGTWERGTRTPPLNALIGLRRELGVSIDELMTGEPPPADGPNREKQDRVIT